VRAESSGELAVESSEFSADRRPEAAFDAHRCWPPTTDYRRLTKPGEQTDDLAPAGSEFPRNVSVVTLAWNEGVNIRRALQSVSGANDRVVVDSGSTDATAAIAVEEGARVFKHGFVTSSGQRQWALENVPFANKWVFVLDADEWVPRSLAAEVAALVERGDFAAAAARTRIVYEGRWIPRSTLYPSWTVRLLNRDRVRYENRSVNAHPEADGPILQMSSDVVHEDLKSLSLRVRKLERYARLEAVETQRWAGSPLQAVRQAKTLRRRIKVIHSLLPLRATAKAVVLLARGGAFEGRAGWHFVEESWHQERLTARYVRELRAQTRGDSTVAE